MSVSVSVDGLAPTHDALRGLAGSHQAALRAMENLEREGVQVSANTQIGRRNRRELGGIFKQIVQAGAHSWQLQITVAAGRAADDPSLLLEPYHLLEVMPSIARIKPSADAADLRIWPGNNLGYYGPYESLLRGESPLGRKGSCGAGRFVLGIEANGAVKGCPSLPSASYVGGNLRDNGLKDIWERAEPLRFTRDPRIGELWGYCQSCYYADDCVGGCSFDGAFALRQARE
jgi:radical SAM protein with 4Fe4S-binding SPASM domain